MFDLFEIIIESIKSVFYWIYDWLTAPWDGMKAALENSPWFDDQMSVLNSVVGFMDHWIDVSSCQAMTSAFILFWSGLTVYKVVKSWIPTLSGSG